MNVAWLPQGGLIAYSRPTGAAGGAAGNCPAAEEAPITTDSHAPAHGGAAPAASNLPVVIGIALLVAVFAAATATGLTAPLAHHGKEAAAHAPKVMPAYYAVTPFMLLLGAIAVFPLLRGTAHWWESNLHRFYVAAGLGAATLAYYQFAHSAAGTERVLEVLKHAVLLDYIPFIVLLFSLYTISGGIRIEGDLRARPLTNSAFIAMGGLLASFVGTTGAAMLLVRPLLETNQQRHHVQHTVIFFIFVVCNCGGTLLPIGDPPLFMGYLRGVDFLWTLSHLWLPWLVVNGALVAIYFVWDALICYPREASRDLARDITQVRPLRVAGLWPNALLLGGVILAVALLDTKKPWLADSPHPWHPWPYLREAVQLSLVALSLLLGSSQVRRANRFNYAAIIEVAALFIGIFICMQPAIEILDVVGPGMGLRAPWQLFWATGSLSSVLDNAPTYVVFFQTAAANFPGHNFGRLVSQSSQEGRNAAAMLAGISLGAVFLGAMTYIGNGPNFMVKAIAEQAGVKMPSFFGYVFLYSIPVLVPLFVLVTVLFLL